MARGIDYSRRVMVAKEQADDAVSLNTIQRLKIYSFIARYKGIITTSASKAKKTMTKYKLNSKSLKKSHNNVNSHKEIRENDTVKEKMKKKEGKRLGGKDLNETISNSGNSRNTMYEKNKHSQKRKNSEDEREYNKKSKKTKTTFEKKAYKIIKSKTIEAKADTKDFVKTNESGLKSNESSSIRRKNLKQRKEQKDSLMVNKSKAVEENVLVKDFVESSSVNSKLLEGHKNSSEKEDNETPKEGEKVIEETPVNDFEKDSKSLKDPSIIPNMQTNKIPEPDSVLENVVQDVANFEENKLTCEKQLDSETPSGLELNLNLSQKSKSSNQRNIPGPSVQQTDDTVFSMIQPSQESKHSQSTIADFLAVDSEDAVVPDADILSQLSSQPFEE